MCFFEALHQGFRFRALGRGNGSGLLGLGLTGPIIQFWALAQRVLGTTMGDTSLNHNSNSLYRNPTCYYIGTLDPLGRYFGFRAFS